MLLASSALRRCPCPGSLPWRCQPTSATPADSLRRQATGHYRRRPAAPYTGPSGLCCYADRPPTAICRKAGLATQRPQKTYTLFAIVDDEHTHAAGEGLHSGKRLLQPQATSSSNNPLFARILDSRNHVRSTIGPRLRNAWSWSDRLAVAEGRGHFCSQCVGRRQVDRCVRRWRCTSTTTNATLTDRQHDHHHERRHRVLRQDQTPTSLRALSPWRVAVVCRAFRASPHRNQCRPASRHIRMQ
jgi:hypothetical protein